ncbi:MAG: twin-arginine translocation signal domain-containing protein [Chloroflexota bacterium]
MKRRDFLKSSSMAAATALLVSYGLKPSKAQANDT